MRSAVLLLLATACATTGAPEPEAPYVAVRGKRLIHRSGVLDRAIVHAYIITRRTNDERAQTSEYWGRVKFQAQDSWTSEDETYAIHTGEDALEAIERLDAVAESYPHRERYDEGYLPWPGPNSNTFVADVCRRAQIAADLPPTAIGKDWPDVIPHVFAFKVTTTGLGVRLDVGIVGLQVGIVDGVRIHLFGTSMGVVFWPPAIELPFLGRIGFQP